jgi:cation transport ATPase
MTQQGVNIKGDTCLEALEDINKVTFDKKGTLAHGMFVVHHLEHIQKPRKEAL